MDVIGKKLKELEALKLMYQEEAEIKTSEIEFYYKGQKEAIESIQVDESEATKISERIEAIELGDVLLYEHDRLNQLPMNWNYGLFSNEVHHGDRSTAWIYWPRHPRKLEACIDEGILTYEKRDIEMCEGLPM